MSSRRIEKIPVYFSQDDPDQVALFKWVQTKKNRSGYLKRLIQRDMDASSPLGTTAPIGSKVATSQLNHTTPYSLDAQTSGHFPTSGSLGFDAAGFI
ncbi:hypothetical protein [Paenibacillus humicus]|uniref:hypothetical protein n=1 Tax=Paenibacillus humicus TaxID=412861 RepID=UPI000FD8700E|nr:hypothetical protein [Paenibacillus humicus]